MSRDSSQNAGASLLLSRDAEIRRSGHGRHTPEVSMNGGPPHWIPTETGPRLGDPLFLSKTRARGVAEGRAGARAGGWERPSSGVKIIFTSATSGWTLTGREARRASRCPGQVRDRGSVGRALPKPGASACAWTSRPPPGASVPPPAGPPPRSSPPPHCGPAGTVSSFAVSTELCAAPRGAAPRPSKGTAVRGQGGGQG